MLASSVRRPCLSAGRFASPVQLTPRVFREPCERIGFFVLLERRVSKFGLLTRYDFKKNNQLSILNWYSDSILVVQHQ